jgi:hypothetical protein
MPIRHFTQGDDCSRLLRGFECAVEADTSVSAQPSPLCAGNTSTEEVNAMLALNGK